MNKRVKGRLIIGKWSGGGGAQLGIFSDEHPFWIAGVGAPCEDPGVAEAYARLFIAAPVLLKVCKEMLADFCHLCRTMNPQHADCDECDQTRPWRAVIAEAAGEALDG